MSKKKTKEIEERDIIKEDKKEFNMFQTKNIKELINNNSDAYQQIRNAANNSIKDTQIIDNINTKLIRGRS